MLGFLVFVMGFSTLWIMVQLHGRIADLERCVGALCTDLDELRFEVVKEEVNGKE